MQTYVVGFLFSGKSVVLVRKNRPEWQQGLLNGVGGKVEPGEIPYDAMKREFFEETGVHVNLWDKFLLLRYPDAHIHFYRARGNSLNCKTMTDEEIVTEQLSNLWGNDKVVPNLRWIIPMAYYGISLEPVVIDANYNGGN